MTTKTPPNILYINPDQMRADALGCYGHPVVKKPGCRAGHVVREPIECFDIVPTTLELAGVELGHTQFGRSMLACQRGANGDPDRAVFAEGGYARTSHTAARVQPAATRISAGIHGICIIPRAASSRSNLTRPRAAR